MRSRKLLALLLLATLALVGCRGTKDAAPLRAATPGNGTPPNAVYICDGITGACNLMGNDGNPFSVKVVSGSLGDGGVQVISGTIAVYQGDGGGIANAWAVLQTDGTNVLGTAAHPTPGDPTAGDLLNTFVANNTPAVQGILVDAGTRSVIDINVTNEGTVTGEWQLYCGQYVTDAGGTAAAATVPSLQIRCPAGTICGTQLRAPLSCAGGAWYSSVDAGFLLATSAPAMTVTAAALR